MTTSTLASPSASPSHAVSRSSELLNCARTALKIAQASPSPDQHWLLSITGTQLHLHDASPSHTDREILLEDGLTLLRQMKQSLTTLGSLVKRRGHTNDPTEEISRALRQFEEDAKELSSLQQVVLMSRGVLLPQQKRHYELVSAWLQGVASQQTRQLKDVMKTRGAVLNDQAQRRKMLNPSSNKSAAAAASSSSSLLSSSRSKPQSSILRASSSISESPLFTMTGNNNNNNGGTFAAASSAPSSYGYTGSYGGGGGGYGGSNGYGGGYNSTAESSSMTTTGMRQRKAGSLSSTQQPPTGVKDTATTNNTNNNAMQVQIQERQQRRQTQSRLESARQAEQSLAELGTLFGKMSTLIVQQGEVLEKVEDDVEAALGDVTAGHDEIQVLYTIKKGNRALILKVFGILIFFILFMRLY